MSDNEHTLCLQFNSGEWTDEQLSRLVEEVDKEVPEEIGVLAIPDDVEFLTEGQVRDIAETLLEALED